jgi:hypothetical protein
MLPARQHYPAAPLVGEAIVLAAKIMYDLDRRFLNQST